MTTMTNPPRSPLTPRKPTENTEAPRRGPIGRIIAGSLATGLLGALVSTLVVFAGAAEHVITGSALLAFAFGGAMLAVLSTRRTSQPQRWALVPAALMAVTGLGLLVLAPGNGAMTPAGWVWPPALLVLAVWMGVQPRRALAGGSRWLLYPVIGLIAAGAVGGMVESVAIARDQRAFAMPGTSYDVGGYRLHLNCAGTGSPTVVLENGLGETSPVWDRITSAVGRTTRVCAYDRAGQGWSGDAPTPQDGLQIAADLHTLLDRAHESGPYVLVGHSTGGAYALTYAAGIRLRLRAWPCWTPPAPTSSRRSRTTPVPTPRPAACPPCSPAWLGSASPRSCPRRPPQAFLRRPPDRSRRSPQAPAACGTSATSSPSTARCSGRPRR
jgi:hypothetical protein